MNITEEQAREKWCPAPHAPMATDSQSYDPIRDKFAKHPRCIASDCMWWRWDGKQNEKEFAALRDGDEIPDERGYCGIAGRPI